ncbi:MAG: gamma-glutamyl-gamma-aminobutyrate hydrolase family protein [Armatimonadetes bacterium]|nr:gamma-glutamyl-gamma-aminobutyrate hydrolase family protein [Armatimonadota bacterium]
MANLSSVTGFPPVDALPRDASRPAPVRTDPAPVPEQRDQAVLQLTELEHSAQAQECKWASQAAAGPQKCVVGVLTGDAWVKNGFVYLEELAQSILASGGVPRLICPGRGDAGAQLDGVDALLVPGGGNLDPRYFGKEQSEHLVDRSLDTALDKLQMECVTEAEVRSLPMLGICRGMQSMNIAPVPAGKAGALPEAYQDVKLPEGVSWSPGGTLVQDIVHEHPFAPNTLDHWNQQKVENRPLRRFPDHGISIDPHSRLGKILGPNVEVVNSIHRQCIGVVSPMMAVVAWAPDGVPEAIERKDAPHQIGVQWHPEWQRLDDPRMQRLFDTLVDDGARFRRGELGAGKST